jgi:mono/diheme cytochrome c family protein
MFKYVSFLAVSAAMCGSAIAADKAAGEAKYEDVCSACHAKSDWAGKDAKALETAIKDVVAGKTKHKKKLTLTAAEAADIAAFWTTK